MTYLPNSIYRIIIIDYLKPLYCELITGDNILVDFLRICQSDLINEDFFPGLDIMCMICEKGNKRLFDKFVGRFNVWSYPNSEMYHYEFVKIACTCSQAKFIEHLSSTLCIKYSTNSLLNLIQIALTNGQIDIVSHLIDTNLTQVGILDLKSCVKNALETCNIDKIEIILENHVMLLDNNTVNDALLRLHERREN